MASAVAGGQDYETQENWEDESVTQPSQLYHNYPSESMGGSSDDEEEDEEEAHYEPVSFHIFDDFNQLIFPSFFFLQTEPVFYND